MKLRTSTAPSPTIRALFCPNGIHLANTLHPEQAALDGASIVFVTNTNGGRAVAAGPRITGGRGHDR